MQCRRPRFDSWVRKIPWRRDRLPTPGFLGFPGGSDGKEYACNAGDPGLIPGSGRSPGEGNGNPLQYSCLKNPMDREACQATFHGVQVGHDSVTKPPPWQEILYFSSPLLISHGLSLLSYLHFFLIKISFHHLSL